MTQLRDIAELVRLPAALTVPGDTLAGAAAAGTLSGWRPIALAASSMCLYWAGMALNDFADRELDRAERPERPIPSGRVAPSTALGVASGLTLAGVGLAGMTGRKAFTFALPLAGSVWAYDLLAKPTLAGPLVMGSARAFDVLLGAAAAPRRALPAALLMGIHTTAVTGLSRGEVHGSSKKSASAALATTAAVTAGAATSAFRATRRGPVPRLAGAAFAGAYGVAVGRAQANAVATPDAQSVRTATRRGIHGMVPLQASLIAQSGRTLLAAGLAAVTPLLRAAAKVVSPT